MICDGRCVTDDDELECFDVSLWNVQRDRHWKV